jgi:hypothetical protein
MSTVRGLVQRDRFSATSTSSTTEQVGHRYLTTFDLNGAATIEV